MTREHGMVVRSSKQEGNMGRKTETDGECEESGQDMENVDRKEKQQVEIQRIRGNEGSEKLLVSPPDGAIMRTRCKICRG